MNDHFNPLGDDFNVESKNELPDVIIGLKINECTECPFCSRSRGVKNNESFDIYTCYKIKGGKKIAEGPLAPVPDWCPIRLVSSNDI